MEQIFRNAIVTDDIVFNSKRIVKRDNKIVEEYRPVVINGIHTHYLISNIGNVYNSETRKILKATEKYRKGGRSKYIVVNLAVGEERVKCPVHRLVGLAFLPIPKKYAKKGLSYNDLVINHIDGHKWHNVVYNLEWVTQRENMKHAKENNLLNPPKGEKHPFTTITEKEAIEICELFMKGESYKSIMKKYNASKRSLIHMKNKESWKYVTEKYNFPKKKGEHAKPNTIDNNTVHRICELLEEKSHGKNSYSRQSIADMYGVSRAYVDLLANKKVKFEICKDYNF